MSIGAGIYALLQSSASITDAVGQNVAPLVKQQQLVTPCIIYSIAGVTPQHTFTGGAKADVYDVSFHIFDKEYDRVISIARILRNVLDFKSGTYGGWEFRMVRFQGIADDFANDAELYGQTLTFTMRVKNDPTFGLPKVLKTLFSEVGQLHGSVVQVYSLLALCQSDGLMYSAIQLSNALESSCQQSGNFAGNVAVQELYKLTTSIAQSGEFAGRVVAGDTLEVAFLQTGQLGTEVQIAALLSLELVQQGNMSGALEIAAQLATDFEAVGTMQSTLQLAAVLGASYDADGYFGGDAEVEEPAPLFLDLYPNAAAAYSLRQLRTGVANVVRVRRSSDSAEADFTALQITDGSLISWVGAGNNGFVVRWYDASLSGNNGVNSINAQQPLLVSNGVFVAEPIVFNNPNKSALNISTISSDVHSTFIVFKRSNILNAVIMHFNAGYDDVIFVNDNNIRYKTAGVNYTLIASGAFAANSRYLLAILRTSTNVEFFVNGLLLGNLTVSGNFRVNTIGNVGSLGTENNIEAIIHYASNQASNRVAIENELNSLYGIY